ncbi:hypothetical protein SDC9_60366 [bioreactor metagenome]|uniref:Uncharacterized protein n=1 Tax=bioreactor metagenome TaxID=1076179 RepID=A0A644XCQ2_9ZZZZ
MFISSIIKSNGSEVTGRIGCYQHAVERITGQCIGYGSGKLRGNVNIHLVDNGNARVGQVVRLNNQILEIGESGFEIGGIPGNGDSSVAARRDSTLGRNNGNYKSAGLNVKGIILNFTIRSRAAGRKGSTILQSDPHPGKSWFCIVRNKYVACEGCASTGRCGCIELVGIIKVLILIPVDINSNDIA